MKKVFKYILIGILVLGVIYATNFFISTNNQDPIKYESVAPIRTNIEKKTVATGKVVPEDQVEIKPQISGIIEEVFVKEGEILKSGDLIAKIKVVPNEAALNSALGRVDNAKIVLSNAQIDYDRNKALFDKKVISAQDFNGVELRFNQAKQELINAEADLQIIKSGTAGRGAANTNIRSTVSGTVLDIPVKKGDQVIESNNFNPGTTVATIADLTNMIFEGQVDEAEVGKLKIDMPLQISLGAINDKTFEAKLRFVAPQGVEEQGAVQFKIEANVFLDTNFFVRAGYSANATIVIGESTDVLAIKEALVQFDEETEEPFVEVEIGEQQFEKRTIELGISDGINVEILSGLKETDKVKVWNITEPIKKTSDKDKKKKRR
ncbi:efflux RND transporter periplasmic adaptor subunit [Vicingus serpentipes]|uniref:Efflux RND transporter periplasmic adaptor subunit n=1 Tax=Vicingus serpentipes TaxID=1926625 RepID=A0A5C6RTY0_9FLAO|nr:efflux RND transporter periplasmic adaptor subunit [Vicingus serpentipes]TXB65758.1 efflux RND transporter periplasmic adaptor subunit [Vicingus serpentipes]